MDSFVSRNPIPVLMDHREARSGVARALAASPAFRGQTVCLQAGDYLVDGRFLFERKTMSDFVASVISGRLFDQALRLVELKDTYPALILEGTAVDLASSHMRREALQGALVTVALFIGLPILRTRTAEETVGTFLYAARQGRAMVQGGLPRRGVRPKGKRALQSHILQGLPGVGPGRAQHLLQEFGSVEAVMSAGENALRAVEGVGPATARAIRWAVEERRAGYTVVR